MPIPDLGPERILAMLQTHVVDIDGAFAGAPFRPDKGHRCITTDVKLDDLGGSIWPALANGRGLARRVDLVARWQGGRA
jgi:hypothetical protein